MTVYTYIFYEPTVRQSSSVVDFIDMLNEMFWTFLAWIGYTFFGVT
jgi:hypothetical protein